MHSADTFSIKVWTYFENTLKGKPGICQKQRLTPLSLQYCKSLPKWLTVTVRDDR
jgi:hypothetical protein